MKWAANAVSFADQDTIGEIRSAAKAKNQKKRQDMCKSQLKRFASGFES